MFATFIEQKRLITQAHMIKFFAIWTSDTGNSLDIAKQIKWSVWDISAKYHFEMQHSEDDVAFSILTNDMVSIPS